MRPSFFSSSSITARLSASLWASLFALAAAGVLLAGCGGSSASGDIAYSLGDPVSDSTIAATASSGAFGDTLSAQQFQQYLNPRGRGAQTQQLPDSVKQQRQRAMLDQFVDIAALLGEARRRGFSADSASVTARLNQMMQQRMQQMRMRAGGDSAFQERLSKQDMTVEQLRRRMRRQMLQRAPRSQIRKQIILTQLVDTLRREAERNAEAPSSQKIQKRSADQAREVRVQQLLFRVPPRASKTQRDSIHRHAQAVLDSARGATDFSALSSRYGQGGAGGSMGYQTKREMARPFARRGQKPSEIPFVQTAFALQDSGDVAEELVRTRMGYHVIRKTGERAGRPDTVAARRELLAQNQQDAFEQAIEKLRKNVTLRLNKNLVTVDMSRPMPEEEGT